MLSPSLDAEADCLTRCGYTPGGCQKAIADLVESGWIWIAASDDEVVVAKPPYDLIMERAPDGIISLCFWEDNCEEMAQSVKILQPRRDGVEMRV